MVGFYERSNLQYASAPEVDALIVDDWTHLSAGSSTNIDCDAQSTCFSKINTK
jgi:hypothetical protein